MVEIRGQTITAPIVIWILLVINGKAGNIGLQRN